MFATGANHNADVTCTALSIFAEMKSAPSMLRPALESDLETKLMEIGCIYELNKQQSQHFRKDVTEKLERHVSQKHQLTIQIETFQKQTSGLTEERQKMDQDLQESQRRNGELQVALDEQKKETLELSDQVTNFQGRMRDFAQELKAAEDRKDEEASVIKKELNDVRMQLANRDKTIKQQEDSQHCLS